MPKRHTLVQLTVLAALLVPLATAWAGEGTGGEAAASSAAFDRSEPLSQRLSASSLPDLLDSSPGASSGGVGQEQSTGFLVSDGVAGPSSHSSYRGGETAPVFYQNDEGGGGGKARNDTEKGKLYMIVGGAALVGGLLIGKTLGDIIAVAGLGLGIYGIVLYF